MLTRVDIANYRGFKSYQMGELAQVNLIVGKNSCGKTALLEALHFVTSGGDPRVLAETASRRGELIAAEDSTQAFPDLTHFFHGHEFGLDSFFRISSSGGHPSLTVSLEQLPQELPLFDKDDDSYESRAVMGLRIEGAAAFGSASGDVTISSRGAMIFDPKPRVVPIAQSSAGPLHLSLFVATEFASSRRLSQLWRRVLLDGFDSEVLGALRIVEDDIDEIIYVPPEGIMRPGPSFRDFFVRTKQSRSPIPLGSFGDGGRRLMTLALSLSRVTGGTLLIDEVDSGLHYSVMVDVWKLVVKKALESNIQVFATTHSRDCIEGLSELCQREPELASKVAIHKVDRNLPYSLAFGGASLVRMLRHDIDPR